MATWTITNSDLASSYVFTGNNGTITYDDVVFDSDCDFSAWSGAFSVTSGNDITVEADFTTSNGLSLNSDALGTGTIRFTNSSGSYAGQVNFNGGTAFYTGSAGTVTANRSGVFTMGSADTPSSIKTVLGSNRTVITGDVNFSIVNTTVVGHVKGTGWWNGGTATSINGDLTLSLTDSTVGTGGAVVALTEAGNINGNATLIMTNTTVTSGNINAVTTGSVTGDINIILDRVSAAAVAGTVANGGTTTILLTNTTDVSSSRGANNVYGNGATVIYEGKNTGYGAIYGGLSGAGTISGDTSITVRNGASLTQVWGGGGQNASSVVTGTANVLFDGGTATWRIYGGGRLGSVGAVDLALRGASSAPSVYATAGGSVLGDSGIKFSGGTVSGGIYGTGENATGSVGGDSTITVSGASARASSVNGVGAGNLAGNSYINVNDGGTVNTLNVLGGSGTISGDSFVNLDGGTVTGHINSNVAVANVSVNLTGNAYVGGNITLGTNITESGSISLSDGAVVAGTITGGGVNSLISIVNATVGTVNGGTSTGLNKIVLSGSTISSFTGGCGGTVVNEVTDLDANFTGSSGTSGSVSTTYVSATGGSVSGAYLYAAGGVVTGNVDFRYDSNGFYQTVYGNFGAVGGTVDMQINSGTIGVLYGPRANQTLGGLSMTIDGTYDEATGTNDITLNGIRPLYWNATCEGDLDITIGDAKLMYELTMVNGSAVGGDISLVLKDHARINGGNIQVNGNVTGSYGTVEGDVSITIEGSDVQFANIRGRYRNAAADTKYSDFTLRDFQTTLNGAKVNDIRSLTIAGDSSMAFSSELSTASLSKLNFDLTSRDASMGDTGMIRSGNYSSSIAALTDIDVLMTAQQISDGYGYLLSSGVEWSDLSGLTINGSSDVPEYWEVDYDSTAKTLKLQVMTTSLDAGSYAGYTGDGHTNLELDGAEISGNLVGGANAGKTLTVNSGSATQVFAGSINSSDAEVGEVTLNLYGGTMVRNIAGDAVKGGTSSLDTVNMNFYGSLTAGGTSSEVWNFGVGICSSGTLDAAFAVNNISSGSIGSIVGGGRNERGGSIHVGSVQNILDASATAVTLAAGAYVHKAGSAVVDEAATTVAGDVGAVFGGGIVVYGGSATTTASTVTISRAVSNSVFAGSYVTGSGGTGNATVGSVTLDLAAGAGRGIYGGSFVTSGSGTVSYAAINLLSGNFDCCVFAGGYVSGGTDHVEEAVITVGEAANVSGYIYSGGYADGGTSSVAKSTIVFEGDGLFTSKVFAGGYGANATVTESNVLFDSFNGSFGGKLLGSFNQIGFTADGSVSLTDSGLTAATVNISEVGTSYDADYVHRIFDLADDVSFDMSDVVVNGSSSLVQVENLDTFGFAWNTADKSLYLVGVDYEKTETDVLYQISLA